MKNMSNNKNTSGTPNGGKKPSKVKTNAERGSDIKDLLLGAIKSEQRVTGPITVEQLSAGFFILLVDIRNKFNDSDPKEWQFMRDQLKPLFIDKPALQDDPSN